jgi:hypothetical protein
VAGFGEDRQQLAGQAQAPLDGLPAVGVDAQRDGLAAVAGGGKLRRSTAGASGFQAIFVSKSSPGEAQIGMARARETVGAAVLATL